MFDAITGWAELEHERTEMQLFAARRVAYCVLTSQGWKGRESEIMELEVDERNRKKEIEKYGYATVTQLGGTGERSDT